MKSETCGECVRYVEVLDDQLANRQIEVYRNGMILKYDRGFESDEFGRLIGTRLSRKPKWQKLFKGVVVLQKHEFDLAWNRFERRIA